ncbi:unnamed protein product [Heligmosomoides polygyrus]|uniref:Ferredoxin--NADP(+) reductase n=1 Tax=Heligmosomoides polygyrus TaxID=6339 RepID=A0A183G328_HELPZ|nr:unnamed protein product [Heligmosomoides polygyrus]
MHVLQGRQVALVTKYEQGPKEMSWPRIEEVGHPNLDFVEVDELLPNQGVLHRAEYVVVGWGNVRAVQRMKQNGPLVSLNFLLNDFCDMRPRLGFKFGAGSGVGFEADKLHCKLPSRPCRIGFNGNP